MNAAGSLSLTIAIERWPIAGTFTISRGAKSEAVVVLAQVTDGRHSGRGECVPYARYGESAESVAEALGGMRGPLREGLSRQELGQRMPAGAARNALDCALWDLAAKQAGRPVHELVGVPSPKPCVTAYTISLGSPEAMRADAEKASHRPLLKVKLGGAGDVARIRAVRAAAPDSELIVDANESWSADDLAAHIAACADAGVTLIEQPLPAGRDAALADIAHPVPICADESVHDRASLASLRGKYDAVNIKLDKTGGLTEALALAQDAERAGFAVMVGCMVATSLSMAPAMLIAQRARVVDLDGALLLARDRPDGLRYENGLLYPASSALWG